MGNEQSMEGLGNQAFHFRKDFKMLVHGRINSSSVNGPGNRAVLWVAGCSLNCQGCWNPETHAFDQRKETSIGEIQTWITGLKDVEGITFSGGEPMQQAPYLYVLVAWIKENRPDLSIGMYTGYSKKELENGSFRWKSAYDAEWVRGSKQLWNEIKKHLDFAITGRYIQSVACHSDALRSSKNQEVIFFTNKYKETDLPPQIAEVTITDEALVQLTGYPTMEFLDQIRVSKPSNPKPLTVSASCVDDNDEGLVGV